MRNALARLKRQLTASEASQSEAADALAESEAATSSANRRLRELAARRAQIEQQIGALAKRESEVARRQSSQQEQLDLLLRELQVLSLDDPLQRIVGGRDAGQLDRDSAYIGYLGRATASQLEALKERRSELVSLQKESQQKRDELLDITKDEQKSRALLQKEGERRKRALDQVSKEISTQRQSIARVERDEKRLAALVDSISKVMAEQARRDAERARNQAAKRSASKAASKSVPAPNASETTTSAPNEQLSRQNAVNFAQRKGHLTLPVSGTIIARFGAPRRGEGGAGGPTWKGIFLRAPAGAEVRAVGDGTIVFSDWLRGFGNLLVIDHGDGYLSIYGNNESLLRNIGDKVLVGDVVASVGNTGGNEYPGLYFELRSQGRPFDPLAWVAAR